MTFAALLADVVERLDRAGAPYMVTGAIAGAFHGEARATADLDIVIDPDPGDLERLVDELELGRYYVDRPAARDALRRRSQFNAIREADKVDLIVRKDRPFSVEEFGRRQRVDILGTSVYVATAEDLILAKLEWASETDSDRQVRDAAGIVAASRGTLDRAYLQRWVEALGLGPVWARVESR
jgi:hypothetical protein